MEQLGDQHRGQHLGLPHSWCGVAEDLLGHLIMSHVEPAGPFAAVPQHEGHCRLVRACPRAALPRLPPVMAHAQVSRVCAPTLSMEHGGPPEPDLRRAVPPNMWICVPLGGSIAIMMWLSLHSTSVTSGQGQTVHHFAPHNVVRPPATAGIGVVQRLRSQFSTQPPQVACASPKYPLHMWCRSRGFVVPAGRGCGVVVQAEE